MIFTSFQIWIIILVIMLGTMITRFLPFLIFPEKKEPPKFILHITSCLPPAMMGLLVVYCLRNTDFTGGSFGIPEVVSILIIALLHKWKRNVLLSILSGTVIYMLLIHL